MQRNYRGQRVDTKEWVYGYYTEDPDLGLCYIQGWEYWSSPDGLQRAPNVFEVILETVGQSTGLNDKKQTELYEYDIITDGVFSYIIKWIDFGFWKVQIDQPDKYKSMLYGIENYLKSGTVIDNPELLQEVDK